MKWVTGTWKIMFGEEDKFTQLYAFPFEKTLTVFHTAMDQISKACISIYIIIPAATLLRLHVTHVRGTLSTLHINLDDYLGKKKTNHQ